MSLPIGGGAIDCGNLSSSSSSLPFLFRTRFSISSDASVLSDGSPGSPFGMIIFSCVDDRSRLAGFLTVDSGAVDSPSSPDASRDDACCRGSIERFFEGMVLVLFRLPEPADDGEDMMIIQCREVLLDNQLKSGWMMAAEFALSFFLNAGVS